MFLQIHTTVCGKTRRNVSIIKTNLRTAKFPHKPLCHARRGAGLGAWGVALYLDDGLPEKFTLFARKVTARLRVWGLRTLLGL